jgi:hypothetical protein
MNTSVRPPIYQISSNIHKCKAYRNNLEELIFGFIVILTCLLQCKIHQYTNEFKNGFWQTQRLNFARGDAGAAKTDS